MTKMRWFSASAVLALLVTGCSESSPTSPSATSVGEARSGAALTAPGGEGAPLSSTQQGFLNENLEGLGEAELIDFGPNLTVTKVWVKLRVAIDQSPTIQAGTTLHMTITSVDGFPGHFHGTDSISALDIVEVDREGGVITGVVTWTTDDVSQVTDDIYTVCSSLEIQLPSGTTWNGPERCVDFGPFFP